MAPESLRSRTYTLEALEQGGEPGAAADGDDPQRATRADFSRTAGSVAAGVRMNGRLVVFFGVVAFRHDFSPGIRVKQFGEARILRQILEVGVVARLETKCRVQPDSFIQMAQ